MAEPLCVGCSHPVSEHSVELDGCTMGDDDWWCGCPLTHPEQRTAAPAAREEASRDDE